MEGDAVIRTVAHHPEHSPSSLRSNVKGGGPKVQNKSCSSCFRIFLPLGTPQSGDDSAQYLSQKHTHFI